MHESSSPISWVSISNPKIRKWHSWPMVRIIDHIFNAMYPKKKTHYPKPNGKAHHALKVLWFFSLFSLFPTGSFQVFNMFSRFSMCSTRVFPIAPLFNPICFAQSPPILTYIAGPKGQALHFSIESSIFLVASMGSTFLFAMGQSSWLTANKIELGLMRHPQLINMKQTKYPN